MLQKANRFLRYSLNTRSNFIPFDFVKKAELIVETIIFEKFFLYQSFNIHIDSIWKYKKIIIIKEFFLLCEKDDC